MPSEYEVLVRQHFEEHHRMGGPTACYPYVDCYSMKLVESPLHIVVTVEYLLVNTCDIVEERAKHYVFEKEENDVHEGTEGDS